MGIGMAMAPGTPPPALEARSFDVIDENGVVMASFRCDGSVPELVFFDKAGSALTEREARFRRVPAARAERGEDDLVSESRLRRFDYGGSQESRAVGARLLG
jgi:hypothetical protein